MQKMVKKKVNEYFNNGDSTTSTTRKMIFTDTWFVTIF